MLKQICFTLEITTCPPPYDQHWADEDEAMICLREESRIDSRLYSDIDMQIVGHTFSRHFASLNFFFYKKLTDSSEIKLLTLFLFLNLKNILICFSN